MIRSLLPSAWVYWMAGPIPNAVLVTVVIVAAPAVSLKLPCEINVLPDAKSKIENRPEDGLKFTSVVALLMTSWPRVERMPSRIKPAAKYNRDFTF